MTESCLLGNNNFQCQELQMTKQEWLIDEAVRPNVVTIEQMQREISSY